ncbi:PucR family transcriptional regulator [Actinokineospora bangkokensis]|uniref:Uncharacterized protein n=1 Tax=Actinokineospora bangkokensis TaxID=1193682 RepID=A0A1Q9LJD2_9PSEU|nr:PucR family transcriptional regulator [Actinokineospora bangkokensis]OLR92105.1 hypothetical protein BJP25_22430 [Actinokineospora bangkokensis]
MPAGPPRPAGQPPARGALAPRAHAQHPPTPPSPVDPTRTIGAARALWSAIPQALADRLRRESTDLVREVITEIRAAVPAYDQPLQGQFREVLVGSVEMAVVRCFDSSADVSGAVHDWTNAFTYAGKVEHAQGRTMDALQTAVRVGARVVWRRMSAVGREMGVPTDTLFTLADRIFAYVDEVCAVAIAGFSEAQSNATGALERRRRQLMKLILATPPVAPQAIADLAGTTDWVVPDEVAVIAVEHRPGFPTTTALGGELLVDLESADPCVVVADPDRHLPALTRALAGRRAAVGPTVPLSEAHRSLACARRALTLVQRGVLPDTPTTRCTDHLSALVLLSDEFLLDQLTARALAPFADLTDKQRERLTATLLAWLETRGGINDIAARLDVHPQTVRYRMHQVEELLGERLDDPQERLCMEIALRARALLTPRVPNQRTPADHDEDDEPRPPYRLAAAR